MSTDIAYQAICGFLVANWTATPLEFENINFVPPVDADGVMTPWVSVEIAGNSYAQASIGAEIPSDNLWREEGQLWLHVFVPAGTGSLLARQYARQLVDLFKGLDLDPDIEFRDASVGLGEPGDENGIAWRLSTSIDWIRG